MKTKYYLVFLVLLLSLLSNNAIAQKCLMFTYDMDGNRICKYVQNNCDEKRDFKEDKDNEVVTDVSVYPNPTDGEFTIIIPQTDGKNTYCHLYDMNGGLIMEKSLGIETNINIGQMPNGVYLLRIVSGEETYTKIILKH